MVMTARDVTQGDLRVTKSGVHARQSRRRAAPAGVRAPIVARKRRSGCGAKGRRKRNS
jgi:hypothetical protein